MSRISARFRSSSTTPAFTSSKAFQDITDEDWLRFFEVNVMSGVRLLPRAPASHAAPELGPDHFRVLGIRHQHPEGNDPLRHDENGPARDFARPGRTHERHAGHGEYRRARPDRVRGRHRFRQRRCRLQGKDQEAVEEEFFKTVRPTSLLQRFEDPMEIAQTIVFVASPLCRAPSMALRAGYQSVIDRCSTP